MRIYPFLNLKLKKIFPSITNVSWVRHLCEKYLYSVVLDCYYLEILKEIPVISLNL